MLKTALTILHAVILIYALPASISWADFNTDYHYNRPPFDPRKTLSPVSRLIPIPLDPLPSPYFPTKQRNYCRTWKFTGPHVIQPTFIHFMHLAQLHKIASGKGQKIAIIDTGISPNKRYKSLIDGGDYIAQNSGLEDCSGHGSLVAGLIGAAPTIYDKFVGVAPDAQIISIRAAADDLYEYNLYGHITDQELQEHPLGGITELAHAITHAANMGATIINISVTKCYDIANPPNTQELRDALLYAVQIKHIVVIAASGNSDGTFTGRGCKNNPGFDPAHPADIRNWHGLINLSFPSYYQPLVLSVGSTDNKGVPLTSSLIGPWVNVAAPGFHITSFNRDASPRQSRYVNAQYDSETRRTTPIDGTSFAAPLVTGLTALIRERFPQLSPWQVINRIESTAHHPAGGQNNFIGYGVIDALAALTAQVPLNTPISPPGLPDSVVTLPSPSTSEDYTTLLFAAYISAGSIVCILCVGISVYLRRKDI